MSKARIFLKVAESVYPSSSEDYASLRNKWSVSRILEFERQIAGQSTPKTIGAKDDQANHHCNPQKKNKRSPFVRIETFSSQLRRVKKAFETTLTNAKRLNPSDCPKALVLIERILPEEIRPYFAVILESSPKTPANQGGQS
jgi:hypothetical protein